jgi:hypothetical protein
MLSIARRKIYRLRDMVKSRKAAEMLAFLRYDGTSFAQFAERIGLPNSLRAIFAENHLMSMGEMIKSFHYYFLSNDLRWLYDFLNDDFDASFLQPAQRYLESQGVEIRLGQPARKLERKNGSFAVGRGRFDYLVLATDIRTARRLAESSPFIRRESPDTHRATPCCASGWTAARSRRCRTSYPPIACACWIRSRSTTTRRRAPGNGPKKPAEESSSCTPTRCPTTSRKTGRSVTR